MIISEAWRIFKRRLRVSINGLEKFTGTDDEICRNIINECWNGRYFQVSPGKESNYAVFYARDFGWCIESLINLGYKKKVIETLDYALSIYQKHKRITVAIDPEGKTFNFPDVYSPDSVAYIFRSLRIAKAKELINKFSAFLNSETQKFKGMCIDDSGNIIKKHFSGMRDYAIVRGSCYDMIMACMLDDEIKKINILMKSNIIKNPFEGFELKKRLVKSFWNGRFFADYEGVVYGHNNVYPYYLNIINEKKMLSSSLKAIHTARLDDPIPLKYEPENNHSEFIWNEIFVRGWEHHTSWTMLGMAYIDVLSCIDRKKAVLHLKKFKPLIEKNGFVEVYDVMKPYRSLFYVSETKMLWAAMYLDLKKNL